MIPNSQVNQCLLSYGWVSSTRYTLNLLRRYIRRCLSLLSGTLQNIPNTRLESANTKDNQNLEK